MLRFTFRRVLLICTLNVTPGCWGACNFSQSLAIPFELLIFKELSSIFISQTSRRQVRPWDRTLAPTCCAKHLSEQNSSNDVRFKVCSDFLAEDNIWQLKHDSFAKASVYFPFLANLPPKHCWKDAKWLSGLRICHQAGLNHYSSFWCFFFKFYFLFIFCPFTFLMVYYVLDFLKHCELLEPLPKLLALLCVYNWGL